MSLTNVNLRQEQVINIVLGSLYDFRNTLVEGGFDDDQELIDAIDLVIESYEDK